MVNLRLLQILGLVVTTLLLQGCPKKFDFTVYNNTNGDVLVKIGNQRKVWKKGAVISFHDPSIDVYDGENYFPALILISSEQNLAYPIAKLGRPISSEYTHCQYEGDRVRSNNQICFQLEKDLSLYLVKNELVKDGSNFPVSLNDPQPLGFPINVKLAGETWLTLKKE